MVVQQVDLVDVEDTAAGGGNETRLKAAATCLDGLFDVQRPHQPVLGGAHRQVDDADLSGNGGSVFSRRLAPLAQSLPVLGWAAVGAAAQDGDLGQQVGQGTDGSGLGRAFLATDEHAAYTGVDGVQDQGPFHRSLPDDGGEGEARFGLFGQGCSSRYWLGVWRSRQSITSPHSGLSSVAPDRSFQWCLFVEIEIEPGPPRHRVRSDPCSHPKDILDQAR